MTKNHKILIGLLLILPGIYPFYQLINRFNIDNGTYYLTHHSLSFPVGFDHQWKTMLQDGFAQEFNSLRNSTLITLDNQKVTIQSKFGTEITELDNEHNLYFFNGWFSLKRSLSGQVTLTSLDDRITLYLASTKVNAQMKSVIETTIQEKNAQLTENIAKFSKKIEDEQLIEDFIGTTKPLNEHLSIKIPLFNSYKFFDQFGGTFMMNIAGIPINHNNKGTTAYHLQNEENNASAYVVTINSPKQLVDINSYVPKNSVVFQEQNGAIFFNTQGLYTALYAYYDAQNQQQVIAEYQHQKGYIEDITEIYSIFRTLDPVHKGETFSLELLSLTPEQFQEKFKIKVSNTFKDLKFFHKLQTKLNDIVNSPLRYTQSYTDHGKESWIGFGIESLDLKNSETFWINKKAIIHYQSMQSVLDHFQQRDPNGKVYENIFTWSEPTEHKKFSILTEDNGITYEIRLGEYHFDDKENNAEQAELSLLVLLNMFIKQQEPFGINQNSDLTNAGHHPAYRDDLSAPIPIFPIKNGAIDAKGNQVLKVSEVYRAHYLDQKYLQINDKYLLDANGTLLINNDSMSHIKGDLFITKDPKSQNQVGIYDFAQEKWVIRPIYANWTQQDNLISFVKHKHALNSDVYLDNLTYLGEAYHVENIHETNQVMLFRNAGTKFKLFDYQGNLITESDKSLGFAGYSPKERLYIMKIFKNGDHQYVPLTLDGRFYPDLYSEYHMDNGKIFVKKTNEDAFNELRY